MSSSPSQHFFHLLLFLSQFWRHFGGRLGPDADKVVAVQAVIHIDAVAVEMEVRDTGLAVRMERDDVLGFGWKMVGRLSSLYLCLALKILGFNSDFDPVTNLFCRNIIFGRHPFKILCSLEQLR